MIWGAFGPILGQNAYLIGKNGDFPTLVAYLDVWHDAYLGYQNVSNNTRNHNFGGLGDFGYNWTDIGSKSVPQRGKNDNLPTVLCL